MSTLKNFPTPSVAVDAALLTVLDDARLGVLVLPAETGADGMGERLPGTFLHEGEVLAEAVLRALKEKADVNGAAPRQLRVFDAIDRDARGRVLSVAHVDVVRRETLPADVLLYPVDALPELDFDHAEIVEHAVHAVRAEYREHPDPARLLAGPFTLSQLRALHTAVLGEPILPDTFRRTMLPELESTGDFARAGRGRPAELFEHAESATGR